MFTMPITHTIDYEKRRICSTCSDVMTRKDFSLHMESVWNNVQHYGFDELVDTTQADWSEFKFSDVFEIVKKEFELIGLSSNSGLAWVVEKGMQEDIARFYLTSLGFTTKKPRRIDLFYSHENATEWLES